MSDLISFAEKPEKLAPVTSAAIKLGMAKTWAAPEYAIMWEVGDATGARHTRFADAVVMSLWPSRGLELHGVEIKVSRSDWKREAADPKKAETIAKYCDRWYIHTAPNVIQDISEVPPLWGLREFDGKKWRTIREATKNPEPVAINRTFLAALLRRADQVQREVAQENAQAMIAADREQFQKRIDEEVERRTRRNTEALQMMEQFEEASGISMKDYNFLTDAKEIGRLVKTIQAAGVLRSWDGLTSVRDATRRALDEMEKAILESGIPFPEVPQIKRRARGANL